MRRCRVPRCELGKEAVFSWFNGCRGCLKCKPEGKGSSVNVAHPHDCKNGDARKACQNPNGCPMRRCRVPKCKLGEAAMFSWFSGCRGCLNCKPETLQPAPVLPPPPPTLHPKDCKNGDVRKQCQNPHGCPMKRCR